MNDLAKQPFNLAASHGAEEPRCTMHDMLVTVERLAGVGGWCTDVVKGRLYWSEEAYRIAGRDPQSFPTTIANFLSIVHPDDLDRVQRARAATMEHKAPYDLEYRIVRPDGTERFVHSQAELTLDDAGKVVRLTGTVHDITERKAAERQARDELQRTQTQLTVVGQIGKSEALMAGDVEAVAREITELASRATGCGRVSVWLFNDAETELRCIDLFEAKTARHLSGMILSQDDLGDEIAVIKTARYINSDDPLTDLRTKRYVETVLKPNRITSLLDAAVQASNQHFGLLCFAHVEQPHHWTQDEIAFACQLGDKIGMAVISNKRRQAEAALRQRDALLHAVAISANEFVTAPNLDEAMPKALELVSKTLQVDRIAVLERAESVSTVPMLRYVWQRPEIGFQLDQKHLESLGPPAPEVTAWHAPLFEGKTILSNVREATGVVKTMLEVYGTKTILVIPILVDGKYWGQIGLDTIAEREWADYEIEILQMMGELVVNSIRRERYVREIDDANRIIHNTPTVLYRLGGTPDLPMSYISHNMTLFGHEPAALMASPHAYWRLVHRDDAAAVRDSVARVLDGGEEHGVVEYRMLTGDGGYRWMENRFSPIRDAAGRLIEVEGLLFDITERKAAEAKISRLARTDALTGLANRATFFERLRQAFAASRRGGPAFALVYVDIDHFKDINDTLGHPVGDHVLKTVGERLKASVRESDMVARLGGDEFAIVQFGLGDASGVGALAAKVRTALAAPMMVDGNEMHITASIGIATYGAEIATPDDMLARADVALYRAKEEGRDQYRFHTEELDAHVRAQVVVTEDLALAISRNEFELHYQPQVEFASGAVVGMEAVIRWRHPTRGLLMPSAFLSFAERSGAITPIGHWMIDRACEQMSLWRQSGIAPPTMAVNVSYAQIKKGDELVQFVARTLAKWQLAAHELQFDVTESVLVRAAMAQNPVLERLHKLGVRTSIDDFGSKYSSLHHLGLYGVNRLTIPQPLIAAATRHRDSAAVVRAIISLACELDIEVIAQGLETEAQWSLLTAHLPRGDLRGSYYGDAVPAADAAELLRRGLAEPAQAPGRTLTGSRI